MCFYLMYSIHFFSFFYISSIHITPFSILNSKENKNFFKKSFLLCRPFLSHFFYLFNFFNFILPFPFFPFSYLFLFISRIVCSLLL
ncbi:hypothetical protein F4703DRAFT_1306772 [Phycomyces blakesleeanus]